MKISEEIQAVLNKLYIITDKFGGDNIKLAMEIEDVVVSLTELRHLCTYMENSAQEAA